MKTESFLPIFPGAYGTIFEDIDFNQKDEVGASLTNVINRCICNLGIKAEYQSFISPKFYNFENDSIYVEYTYDSLDVLIAWIRDNVDDVSKELKNRYTSCDGFISHHSIYVNEWIDVLDIDSHKLGAMLDIYLTIEDDIDQIESEMYENLFSNGLVIYDEEFDN